ncbi:hypothetical protein EBR77_03535 [bacterium]|nr:hypothetical protein [bacterium]
MKKVVLSLGLFLTSVCVFTADGLFDARLARQAMLRAMPANQIEAREEQIRAGNLRPLALFVEIANARQDDGDRDGAIEMWHRIAALAQEVRDNNLENVELVRRANGFIELVQHNRRALIGGEDDRVVADDIRDLEDRFVAGAADVQVNDQQEDNFDDDDNNQDEERKEDDDGDQESASF